MRVTGKFGTTFALLFLVGVAVAGVWGLELVAGSEAARHSALVAPGDSVAAARQQAFNETLGRVTQVLVATLNDQGVQGIDVIASGSVARSHEGIFWNREELDFELPGEAETLAQALKARLAGIQGATYSLSAANGEQVMELRVLVGERETHRLYVRPLVRSKNPKIAIVIDDIGYKRKEALALMNLNVGLTFAVLPDGPYSQELATAAANTGHEVMLHLPLEPERELSGVFPEDILKTDLPAAELRARVRDALRRVPQAAGMNNHMGSRFTQDEVAMAVVLSELAARDLYFVDSRTTSATVGLKVARKLGIPAAARAVFLDEDQEYEATVRQLEEAFAMATARGSLIVIGHPYPSTVAALADALPRLQAMGLEVVPASEVVSVPLTLGEGVLSPGP